MSNSRKHRPYEPKSCGSSGVENAKDHGREFDPFQNVLSNVSQPFQKTSWPVCKSVKDDLAN